MLLQVKNHLQSSQIEMPVFLPAWGSMKQDQNTALVATDKGCLC